MDATAVATVVSRSWYYSRLRLIALCLAEARPQVQVAFLLRFACGAALSAPAAGLPFARIVAGLLVWECTVVAVYLFNGIADVVGDRVNGLRRPIADNRLAPDTAKLFAAAFAAVSVAGATILGFAFTIATVAALLLGYLYSGSPFDLRKRPIGASALALTGGLTTYVAGSLAAQRPPNAASAVLALAMSLWMGLIGATVKDFADRAGDAATGRQTLISRFSEAAARRLVIIAAPAIGLALVVAALSFAKILLTGALAVLAGGVIVNLRTRRIAAATQREVLAEPYRAFMATQLAAHVFVLGAVFAGIEPVAG